MRNSSAQQDNVPRKKFETWWVTGREESSWGSFWDGRKFMGDMGNKSSWGTLELFVAGRNAPRSLQAPSFSTVTKGFCSLVRYLFYTILWHKILDLFWMVEVSTIME